VTQGKGTWRRPHRRKERRRADSTARQRPAQGDGGEVSGGRSK
jgi:hypothetical protein